MIQRHGLEEFGDSHSSARDIPQELRESHFIFGFMRDPVQCEAANYFYHATSWGPDFDTDMGFEGWCEWRLTGKPKSYAEPWIKDPDLRDYGYIFNTRPSAGYFCDENGDCIANHIFRFEEMAGSTSALSKVLGMDCDLKEFDFILNDSRPQSPAVVTPKSEEIVTKAKSIDARLHGTPGKIPTDFHCPTVPDYAYSREDMQS